MVLIFTTFFLCIFGTFLTRSGILSSVHAFAQSPIGPYFATFIVLGLAVSVWILLSKLPFLKSENQLDSLISRESSFLFNNLLLLACTFAVLWGTMFPLLSEAVKGVKITVGAPYFNKITIPIGLALLLLTAVGPLFAWRKTSVESLHKNFTRPLIVSAVATVAFIPFGLWGLYPIMTIFLAFFVIATIAEEFYRGARAIRQKQSLNLLSAAWSLTRRNTRRYGGYVVHFGIALLFIGFVGNAFNVDRQEEMLPGDDFALKGYRFVMVELTPYENDNYAASLAKIDVYEGDTLFTTLYPERRTYKASGQPTTEVAIRPRLNEDVYLVFAGMSEDGQRAVIHAYINPLVNWIWIGTIITVLGTGLALIPSLQTQTARQKASQEKMLDEVTA
jgi:cytochrome c-type biogenesis protein CcmF